MAEKKTEKKTVTKAKETNPSKNSRLLKNPNQTNDSQTYYINGNEAVIIPKSGYHFSKDKAMDAAIEYLKKEHGFVEVK